MPSWEYPCSAPRLDPKRAPLPRLSRLSWHSWITAILLVLLWSERATAYDPEELQGRIAAAKSAIIEGELDRAETMLQALDAELRREMEAEGAEQPDPIEEAALLALKGLVELERGQNAAAVPLFERVLDLRPNRTAVWLYLGQARYGLGDYAGALDALRQGEEVGHGLPGYFLIKARAQAELHRPAAAYRTLSAGLARFESHTDMLREQALVLLQLGLSTAAMEKGRQYLDQSRDEPYAYLVLAEALRNAARLAEATELLEEARLRFLQDPRPAIRLAYLYAARGMHRAAARLFEQRSLVEPRYAFDAADQYRLALRFRDALRCNGRVPDEDRRMKQRVFVLVSAQRYDRAARLAGEIESRGLMDDALRYHLAFACLRSGHLDQAEALLDRIQDHGYQGSARSLRARLEQCRERPSSCP